MRILRLYLLLSLCLFCFLPVNAYQDISETGLYLDIQSMVIAEGVLSFEPHYQLWSDGLTKRRWILLPKGTKLDNSSANEFKFPIGTKLWKEFSYQKSNGDVFKLETRLLEKVTNNNWKMEAYKWNPDQKQAVIVSAQGEDIIGAFADGSNYHIPGRMECRRCHVASGEAVLGFRPLQLSDSKIVQSDAQISSMTNLKLLDLLTSELNFEVDFNFAGVKSAPALGYLYANCMSCHRENGAAQFTHVIFDLNFAAKSCKDHFAFSTTVNKVSSFLLPNATKKSLRIEPGKAESSVVYFRMNTSLLGDRMPALGSNRVDIEGLKVIERWITSMDSDLAQCP